MATHKPDKAPERCYCKACIKWRVDRNRSQEALSFAYLTLLCISPADPVRALHQKTYALVRDAIAKNTGQDIETVQNDYEAEAAGLSQHWSKHYEPGFLDDRGMVRP